MADRAHAEDVNEANQPVPILIKKFPTIEGKTIIRKRQELISGITGRPIEGPFGKPIKPFDTIPHRHVVGETRKQIDEVKSHGYSNHAGKSSTNKPSAKTSQARQNRAPYPLSKIKGIGK